MNHREDLKALIDHELSPQRAKEVREAVEKDILLQAELHEMETIGQAIREMAVQPEPVGLEKTLSALEANKRPLPWWNRIPRGLTLGTLGGVAAIALAVVLLPKALQRPAMDDASADFGSTSTVAAASKKASVLDNSKGAMSNSELFAPKAASADAPAAAGGVMDGFTEGKSLPAKAADVTIQVREIAKAETAIRSLVGDLKGTVEKANVMNRSTGQSQAEFVIRVPQGQLKAFLHDVKRQGSVIADDFKETNIEPEVKDLQSKADAETKNAQEIGEIQNRSKVTSEQIRLRDEKRKAEESRAQAQKRIATLKSQIVMSTVRVKLLTDRHKKIDPAPNKGG